MRQILLDTETTGLDPAAGHRIIEIGCVELLNRRFTGNNFHRYINPEREVEEGAVEVHGITNDFLQDKPRFANIADEFLEYIRGAELVIHNAPFDVGFINHELDLLPSRPGRLEDYCSVLDTLVLARKRHPGQKNNLDALCKRYGIDNSHRELHGALLDSEILGEVYLAMTGGQVSLLQEQQADQHGPGGYAQTIRRVSADRPSLPTPQPSDDELSAHTNKLAALDKASGGNCLWSRVQ